MIFSRRSGKPLEQLGTPDEVTGAPANDFVEDFLADFDVEPKADDGAASEAEAMLQAQLVEIRAAHAALGLRIRELEQAQQGAVEATPATAYMCSEGHEGILCADCSDGYFFKNKECLPCDGELLSSEAAVAIAVLIGADGRVLKVFDSVDAQSFPTTLLASLRRD